MQPRNLLFIMSDEHSRSILGCYGNKAVHTPRLDALAAAGTRFDQAYTPSPVCVSARASLATGRWVHDTGSWSSAEPYDGSIPGWGHRLIDSGHDVASIGKLHYRSRHDANGFREELLPLHVVGGTGWTKGLLRGRPLPSYDDSTSEFARQVGVGETAYAHYDRTICETACKWLETRQGGTEKPWVLFVSFVSPHYPLIAPEAFHRLHNFDEIGWPRRHRWRPDHPVLQEIYRFYNYNDHFSEDAVRQARLGYYGLCAFLDSLVGRLLDTLEATGLSSETNVLYTTDHGEMLGDHGMWTKMLMYEGSAGIPMILAGPEVPSGRVVDTPVSLIDCHQTVLRSVGLEPDEAEADLPGRSLFDIAAGSRPERTILSEYHDGGSPTGYFMIRRDDWKYVHYVGGPPQLFNLAEDPFEEDDLAGSAAYGGVRRDCEAALRDLCDPERVNERAFADQERQVKKLGGREAVLAMEGGHFGFTPLVDIAEELQLSRCEGLDA